MPAVKGEFAIGSWSPPRTSRKGEVEKVSGTVVLPWAPAGAQRRLKPQAFHRSLDPAGAAKGGTAIDRAAQGLELGLILRSINPLCPVARARERPCTEKCARLGVAVGVAPKTAPTPILGPFHEPRAQGVSLYVATDRQEVGVGLHQKGLESALVEMATAGASPMGMPALGVGERHKAHEGRQIPIVTGPQEQMPMIGHEAIGEQAHGHALAGLGEHPFKGPVVFIFFKDRHARIGAIEHVIDQSALGGAVRSSHDGAG